MSAIILEYWRRVTFDFVSPKGSTSGVFDVKVDSKGVPIVEKNSCIWKNVSGDSLTFCQYSPDDMAIQTANGGGAITDFSVALENTTYTIAVGKWSYVNANVEGFTITTSTGTGCKIEPEGNVTVLSGADQSFIVGTSNGYELSSVLVDGVESISQLVDNEYTFTNVQADHTISASGTALPTYNITSTAGVGGTISPSGTTSVYEGYSQEYSITPAEGYEITSVLVDGVDAGKVTTYTFTDVNAVHTISASFEESATYGFNLDKMVDTDYLMQGIMKK